MSLRDSLLLLAQKSSHKIPEIRERSIRALCAKLLSPLVSDEYFIVLSEAPGFITSILEWVNERYDTCDYRLLRDVIAACQRMVERSEVLRTTFLDAGGVAFFDEFAVHNPGMKNEVEQLVTAILQGGQQITPIQRSPGPECKPYPHPATPSGLPEVHPTAVVTNDDEQVLFDLAVRIKFATQATSPSCVEEVACAIIHSIGPILPASTFVEFPVIIEAICGQLKMSNSINPITNKCCESLLILIDKVLDRLVAQSCHFTSAWTANLLSSLIESFGRRPDCIYRTSKIALRLLRIMGSLDSQSTLPQLESIVRATVLSVSALFPPEKYFVEKFDFAESLTPVLLRKLHTPLSPQEFVVAQIAIEVMSFISQLSVDMAGLCPKGIDVVQHVSDWICDEKFYNSSRNAKALASKAAIALADDTFDRARQILISVRKLQSREILTETDFSHLMTVFTRVPDLLGERNNPVEILSLMIEQGEWKFLTEALASDSNLADAMIDIAGTKTMDPTSRPPPGWLMGAIALNISTRPRLFVSAVLELFPQEFEWLEFFTLKLSETSVSIDALVRSLFSTNQAIRKQSFVNLWHQQPGVTGECPVDLCYEFHDNPISKYKLKSPISVEDSELISACKLALNSRLTTEIRIASATQACTLIVNSCGKDLTKNILDVCEFISVLCAVSSEEFELVTHLCDLFCLLSDTGLIVIPTENSRKSILRSLVGLLFSTHSVHVGRVLSRFVFARPNDVPNDNIYWGLINHLKLIGDYDPMDLGVGRSVDRPNWLNQFPVYSEKMLAICVSLADSLGSPVREFSSSNIAEIEGAIFAQIPLDDSALKKFVLSIEALVSADDYVSSVLIPAVRISNLLPSNYPLRDSIMDTVARVCETISLENLSEWDVASLVDIQKSLLLHRSGSSIPGWVPRLLETNSNAVVHAVIEFFVSVTFVKSELDHDIVGMIEKAVFKHPTRYSLLSWLWIVARSGSIEPSGMEKISQLLDNEGEIGELAWWLVCECKDMFSFDDTEVWKMAIDKISSVSGASSYVAKSIIMSPARAGDIMDLVESGRIACNLEILVGLSKTQKRSDLTNFLSQSKFWETLVDGDPQLLLDLVVECTRDNPRLLIFIMHSGGIGRVLLELANPSESLIELIQRATEFTDTYKLNHFDCIVNWVCGEKFFALVLHATNNDDPHLRYLGFELCRVGCIFARENFTGTVSCAGTKWIESVITEKNLLDSNACAALTETVRLIRPLPLSLSLRTLLADLMRFHDSVPVPDSIEIFSSEGSVLFYAQSRFIASIVSEELIDEYSRWFVSVWQRALCIVETKKTSSIPILTEILCGLVDVLYRYPKSKLLAQPLSYVLSYATRTTEISPSLFSLCLSAGEAASPLLIDKPVVGKILRSLISLHATAHSRMIPKSVESISKLGSVVRFASAMIGCKVCGSEIMGILDGWVEATDVIDKDLLTRVVGAIVVAPGTHSRTSLGSTQKGKFILEYVASSGSTEIGMAIFEVMQATSFKLNRDTTAATTVCGA